MPRDPAYAPLSQAEYLPTQDSHGRDEEDPVPLVRPAIYYNEGPFSAPSSVDGDEDANEKNVGVLGGDHIEGAAGDEEGFVYTNSVPRKRRSSPLRALLIALAALVLTATLIGLLAARTYNPGSTYLHGNGPGRRRISLDDVFNGTFSVEKKSLDWVKEAGDGVYSVRDGASIDLVDLKTNTTKTLLKVTDVRDEHGRVLPFGEWSLSPDMQYALLKTDNVKQWRWSSFGNYYVYDLKTHATYPIAAPSTPPTIAYATWSPTGEAIAYVSSNDIYVIPSLDVTPPTSIRLTTQGTPSLFHGVPDWVYEEEVFSAKFALWWSPDSKMIAYLKMDETNVDDYLYPVYNPTQNASTITPYPEYINMKYPKPGYPNPIVTVHVSVIGDASESESHTLDLSWPGQLPSDNGIISEVAWVSSDTLIVKEVDRTWTEGNVVLFDLREGKGGEQGTIVRKLGKSGEQGDDGWIDQGATIFPLITQTKSSSSPSAYLDIVPNSDGYNHIALFSPADSSFPKWLTGGAKGVTWEVTGGVQGVDYEKGVIYFTAASPSTDRHLYSIALPSLPIAADFASPAPTALTDTSQSSYHSVSFSPFAGYYVLNYEGPLVPRQTVGQVGNSSFKDILLTSNERLNATLEEIQLPVISRFTIQTEDGIELNAMEIRPPSMDDSGRTKYPVLFRVYGGPDSQLVSSKFGYGDWHSYLASSLKYIVVIVDGRGTGFKGRKLRNWVRGRLGEWEVKDQIDAARQWAKKKYVDPRRIGIWGWSYGGYMTTKVIEADVGIHTLGIAVAPVTSWELYDSIYTERYMQLPQTNREGYDNSSVRNMGGFKKDGVLFALAHGSGDDNVHFANTARLLDLFTSAQVRNYVFRMFTDSDHSINTRGANRELYEWMTNLLGERWGWRGPVHRGW